LSGNFLISPYLHNTLWRIEPTFSINC
jgi:hypothetical protein